jgi:hypothetical protein
MYANNEGNYSDKYSSYISGRDSHESQFAFGSRGYFEYSRFLNVNRSSSGTIFEVLHGSDVRIYHCSFNDITLTSNLISGIMFGSLRVDNTSFANITIYNGNLLFLTKLRFLDIKNVALSNIVVENGLIMISATNLNMATLQNISIGKLVGTFLSCHDATILVLNNCRINSQRSANNLQGTLFDLMSSSVLNISRFSADGVRAQAREMIRIEESTINMVSSNINDFRTEEVDLLFGIFSVASFINCNFTLFSDYLMNLKGVDLRINSSRFINDGNLSKIKSISLGKYYCTGIIFPKYF